MHSAFFQHHITSICNADATHTHALSFSFSFFCCLQPLLHFSIYHLNITTISYSKMVLTSNNKNKLRKRTWDREDDLYIHLQDNINNNNINFFNNLLDKFIVNNPKADSELMQFTDGSSNIIQSQILHLQDQNRDNNNNNNNTAEENNTENEVEPQNGFLLQNMRPHGKSHVLEIVKDGVFVTYEEESSCENHKGKLSVKKSKGKKSPSVKGKKLKGKKRERKRKIDVHVPVNVNEKGVDSAVKAACIEEVTVKKEIQDNAYDDDDDDDFKIMPVESPADNEVNPRKMTEFREKLMNELNRPYSKEEHEKLLRDIKVQKPVQNYKDLRGRIKIYEEDRAGKSFLEHNLDLAKQIEAARDDPPKELCLLRGFFFWLSNSTLEGDFMPWRVPSCLDEWYHNNRKG
ncbi:general transcriptional corepressor trfA-like [Trifolium pratense]|uniref:general transcriptional corepressor trfA-like n=1 Tax=Trifolium pratense TaxID=57577 RepID=UPI001E697FFD|nr:general transcriptional corepressor trfA-like [Trifolium pratense]